MYHETFQKFTAFYGEHKFFRAGDRIGVAISGGPDSVGLLHLLDRYAPEEGWQLALVHFNHRLRGRDSDEDEHFVRQIAQNRNLPIFCRQADVAAEARRTCSNLEATGHRLRYDFFQSLIEQKQLDKIATGHTANDQAETVLLRLVRGTGTRGLAGIYPTLEGTIIRPLLNLTRAEILNYLKENHLPFRTDISNSDRSFSRNRIRLDLLPNLEREFNPHIIPLLSELAERARDEEEYMVSEADRWLESKTGGEKSVLPTSKFKVLPVALQRQVLRRLVRNFAGPGSALSHIQIEALRRLASRSSSGAVLDLPYQLVVRKEFDNLVFAETQETSEGYRYSISVPGEQVVPNLGLLLQFKIVDAGTFQATYNNGECWVGLDWQKVSSPLLLRNWEPGDRFRPLGDLKALKLKELFQQRKVPSPTRRLWPLLAAEDRIVWVRGFPSETSSAVTPATREVLVIEEKCLGKSGEERQASSEREAENGPEIKHHG